LVPLGSNEFPKGDFPALLVPKNSAEGTRLGRFNGWKKKEIGINKNKRGKKIRRKSVKKGGKK